MVALFLIWLAGSRKPNQAIWNPWHHQKTFFYTRQRKSWKPLQNFFLERYTTSYLDQWEAFVAAVENGTPPPISGADGRAPLVIGMAAKRSMDEGRPVLITEII